MTRTVVEPAATADVRSSVRHPRGLATLFFTEMWERFSYYGMRGLLVLFMTDAATGGLAFDDQTATAVYGLYSAAVYLAALPGGWVADRLMGAQRAVWYGGIVIAAGHFVLAIPHEKSFFLGLALVVLGTGLLKPNISAIVGDLYPDGGARRDAGFSIFYMGINVGAFAGPLVCGYLGEQINWHYGFGAAGVGMVIGLLQYRMTRQHLGEAGRRPAAHAKGEIISAEVNRKHWRAFWMGVGCVAAVLALGLGGAIDFHPLALAQWSTGIILGIAALYFVYLFVFAGLDYQERQRTLVIVVLFLGAALFWSGFEQGGSSLNLFADRYTDRVVAGFEIPATWLQSVNPIMIILFAPLFGAMWVNLARRHLDPSIPTKFALGLILLGLGFLVMFFAARIVATGDKVLPAWLVVTYLMHTFGELCLSPVGLSSVTKLAPRRFVSQMMGIWFLGASLGGLIAGLLAGRFHADAVADMPGLYLQIVLITVGAGILLLAFARPIHRLTGGIR